MQKRERKKKKKSSVQKNRVQIQVGFKKYEITVYPIILLTNYHIDFTYYK